MITLTTLNIVIITFFVFLFKFLFKWLDRIAMVALIGKIVQAVKNKGRAVLNDIADKGENA